MATIKSYSDLQQSKKLAKILPLESADMFYKAGNETQPTFRLHSYGHIMSDKDVCAWSLAALLRLLPKSARLEKGNVTELYRVILPIELKASDWYVEPVDACYELILKLHELNLL